MSDAYSAERAGYAERLARLAGGTTYREPVGGYGTPSDYMPDVHAMAASLAFARRGEADIGPDVAFAVICRKMAHRRKVVTELAAALLASGGRAGERCAYYLPQIASACYSHVVTGEPRAVVAGIAERDWVILSSMGVGLLWDAVSVSVRRAEYAYRSEAA